MTRFQDDGDYKKFLDRAQSDLGGYFEDKTDPFNPRPTEFIRPLKCPYVRILDMRSGQKRNVHFRSLKPLNDMEVLAYMTWTPEDELRLTGPETVETRRDEPQEIGDEYFLR